MSKTTFPLNGILFMLINTMALACIDTCSRFLTQDLSAKLVVFLYKFMLFVIILPWVISGGIKVFKTKKLKLHFLRSGLSVIASICFYKGLMTVKMGEAAVLENIQYLLVSVVGIIFYKEKCTPARVLAIILGVIGACIVTNPNLLNFFSDSYKIYTFNVGHMYIMCAILAWSMNTLTVKALSSTESNKTQMFYLLLFASIIGGISSLIHWNPIELVQGYNLPLLPSLVDFSNVAIELKHIKFLLMMAVLYFIHGISYFNALKSDLSLVIPFRYSKILFSGLLGYVLFNEAEQDLRSYIGYVVIIAASLMLLQEEIIKKKKARNRKEQERKEASNARPLPAVSKAT